MIAKIIRSIVALLFIGLGIFLPFLPSFLPYNIPYVADRIVLPTYYVGIGEVLLFIASVLFYKKLPSFGLWMVYVVLMFLLSSFMLMSSFSLVPILSPEDLTIFAIGKETLIFNIIGLVGNSLIPPYVIYLLLGNESPAEVKPKIKPMNSKKEEETEATPQSPSIKEQLTEKTIAYRPAEVDQVLSQINQTMTTFHEPATPISSPPRMATAPFPTAPISQAPAGPKALDLDRELRITKGRAKSPLFTEDLEKSLSDIFGESLSPSSQTKQTAPSPLASFSSPPAAAISTGSSPSSVDRVTIEKKAEELIRQASIGLHRPVETRSEGLKPLGKMLVDQEAVSNIIAGAEKKVGTITSTRIISAAKGRTLDLLLEDINRYPGVQGSVIVGKDGLVIGSTIPEEAQKELIGAIASSIYSNVDISCNRMNRGSLKQVILETDHGLIIISEIEVGIFIVLAGPEAKNTIGNLIQTIKQTLEVAKTINRATS